MILKPLQLLCLALSLSGTWGDASVYSNIKLTINKPSAQHTTQCDQYSYFIVDMPDPCNDLKITVSPQKGEPDIYVSRTADGDYYPSAGKMTWAAYADGDYVVDISHWAPESSPGSYVIGVTNDCSTQSSPAVYIITATSYVNDDGTDLLLHPNLGASKTIANLDYKFYRFCVPNACTDVTLTFPMGNTVNNDPNYQNYPDVFTSRTATHPDKQDISFKRPPTWPPATTYTLSHTDPSLRDRNGFISGSYYVAVYGWCVPSAMNPDPSTPFGMGYCDNVALTTYNLSVSLAPQGKCGK